MNSPFSGENFRSRLQERERTLGTFLGMGSPMAAEIACSNGVDWVLIDLEHGGGTEDTLGATIVAASAFGVPSLVRVESHERIRIGRALDAGAAGIMIPRITSTAEAKEAVNHMSYPPEGDRGVATYNRSAAWGKDVSVLASGRNAACVIQIETLTALIDVKPIAELPGVDALFIGPLDLSFALGVPRDFTHPTFIEACEKVLTACAKVNKPCGILAPDAFEAQRYLRMGFTFIAIGSDSTLLAKAIAKEISETKETL